MMKIITILLSMFVVTGANTAIVQKTFLKSKVLDIRGGASIGPVDGDMVMDLAKAGATAYVAGAAGKYIATASGSSSSDLADFVTSAPFALNALCAAFAAGMYGLTSSGYDGLKAYTVANILSLVLKINSGGLDKAVDTLLEDKVNTILNLALIYVTFV
mmetsp:Transcript_2969/g.3497  ORF Transcript_2969/g.3497 Transcript_2969/m.3497 type:complete len:159 (-) Transcript_2969:107-583(-)|eukprot:CAMPEP_0194379736 /NCGR_PEP_ID=MMETSP0174-20130528/40252_1 /TAXON_ID=216777 /ORGANISM="Proboscia alata, Strain PI-D3" /LENGTH=158 /DNA_ID=CAMNT_0039162613 /DNA_START=64 /DNA_END=540 /DNA_ORIENTATION=-